MPGLMEKERRQVFYFCVRSVFPARATRSNSSPRVAQSRRIGALLVTRLCAREIEWEREGERASEATKVAQPLWTFVSITHRLGEVSPWRRTLVILAQIFSR